MSTEVSSTHVATRANFGIRLENMPCCACRLRCTYRQHPISMLPSCHRQALCIAVVEYLVRCGSFLLPPLRHPSAGGNVGLKEFRRLIVKWELPIRCTHASATCWHATTGTATAMIAWVLDSPALDRPDHGRMIPCPDIPTASCSRGQRSRSHTDPV